MDDLVRAGQRRLRAAGKRITAQRKLVLEVLAQSGIHLDANDIFERARRVDKRLSLSTIYRTLNAFKETGVVRELHLDQEHHHYELDAKDEHSHLVCLECSRVTEVASDAFSEAAEETARSHGFEIASAQVELTGYCADCRQARKACVPLG
jgi:Fur family ferric uptake transcriptional regulator